MKKRRVRKSRVEIKGPPERRSARTTEEERVERGRRTLSSAYGGVPNVADFVMRYVREHDATEDLRVRDVIGSVDSEHAVNYLKSYEEFIQEPFTFTEP